MTLFSPLNYAILFVYLGSMLGIGCLFARRQKTTEEYFLAGRRMNWLVVGMSMFATLTSAVTYMGLPGMAYKENVSLIVVAIVSPLLAPVLVSLFYPFYRRLNVTTSYEYIDKRFGRQARFAVSGLFILARLGWLGTVIYAPALAMSVVTGLSLSTAILIMGAVATIYTVMGGITADIWTDVVQFLIMLVGAVWLVYALVTGVPGGFHSIWETAKLTGHLDVFHWNLSLTEMSASIVAITFFFQLMQDYGTDQTTVQRLMTIKDFRGMVKATFFNACSDFFFISTLLFIGLGLFAYQAVFPDRLPAGITGDRVLPYFIIHALPDGVSGLLITAIFAAAMSSMDSGISSLSTVVIHDFVRPLRRRPRTEAEDLRLARTLTFAFGAFATAIAFYVSTFKHIIEAYSSIISLFNGPILSIFLLGILTRRTRLEAWIIGSIVAVVVTYAVQVSNQVHWIYFFPISLLTTCAVAYPLSYAFPAKPCPPELTWTGSRRARREESSA